MSLMSVCACVCVFCIEGCHGCFCLYISILSPVEESASEFLSHHDAQPVESHGIYTVYIYMYY